VVNLKKGFLTKDEVIEFLEKIRKNGFRISDRLFDDFKSLIKGEK